MHSLLWELLPSFFEVVLSDTAERRPCPQGAAFPSRWRHFLPHTPPSREPGCGAGVRPFCSSAKTPSFEAHSPQKMACVTPCAVLIQIPGSLPLIPQNLPGLLTASVSVLRLSTFLEKQTSPWTILPTPQPLSFSTTSSLRSLSSLSQLPAPMTFPAPHCLATTPDFHLTSSAPHVQQPFESSETWIGLSTFCLPSCPPKG